MSFGRNQTTRLIAVLSVALLVGCNQQDAIRWFASAQDQATARGYIDDLRHGEWAPIERQIDPGLASADLHGTLLRMANLIPREEPLSVKIVGAQTVHTPEGTAKNLTFEYEFPSGWLVFNVATREKAGHFTIVGLQVYPQPASLEAQNRFRLAGKTPLEYWVLALAVICPLLTLVAGVVCIRSKLNRRKWPWLLFILIGVGKLWVNWTTGAWGVSVLFVQLFSASATAQLYGPWIISFSVPLGAIIFLLRRKALLAPPALGEPRIAPSPP